MTDAVENLHQEFLKVQEACEEKGSRFSAKVRDERKALKAYHASRESELIRLLRDRENTLAEREQHLQIPIGDYADEIQQVREIFMNHNEARDVALQTAVDQFQERLDIALGEEEEWSFQGTQETQAAISSLNKQMRTVKTAIIGSNELHGSQEHLREELQKEKRNVIRLTEEFRKSEQLVSADGLKERWTRDIQSIDELRTQLSAAYHRLPRVEGIASKLENIGRLNGVIRSTERYLSDEKKWVQGELEARSHSEKICTSVEGPTHCLQHPYAQDSDQSNSASGSQSTTQSTLGRAKELENRTTESSSQDKFPRKVTVLNPAMDFKSPSTPPSIEQEQQRRRGGTKPRPILRSTTGFEKQTHGSGEEAPSAPLNHSQYNRPLMAAWNSTSSGRMGSDVVGKIRSGLLSTSQSEKSWAFPTVAEFERSSQICSQDSQVGEKRKPLVAVDNIHKIAKRFKVGSQETSPGDLKASVKTKEASTRATDMRLALRKYSRKTGE